MAEEHRRETEMATDRTTPKPSKRVWAQDVNVAADVLETQAERGQGSRRSWTRAQAAIETGVRRRLDAARNATLRRDPVPSGPGNWWRGTLVEAAYQNLHAAESLIAWLYTPDEVEAEIPEAVARVEAGLDRDDPRRVAALELFDVTTTDTARRARLIKAVEIGFSASDAEYARLRNFRNTVLGGAGAMSVLLLLFVGYVYLTRPTCRSASRRDPGSMVCASGGTAPVAARRHHRDPAGLARRPAGGDHRHQEHARHRLAVQRAPGAGPAEAAARRRERDGRR